MAHVKICPSAISAVDKRVLCATVLESVEAYFQNPNHQRQFDTWKREKDEKEQCLKSK